MKLTINLFYAFYFSYEIQINNIQSKKNENKFIFQNRIYDTTNCKYVGRLNYDERNDF